MVTATIPLSNDQDGVDQFLVDPDTAIEYYNKFVDSLPDYIAAAITPIPLDVLTFGDDQATDVNKIENEIFYNQNFSSPISENSIIGTLNFKVSNKEYFTINIKNSNEIKKKDIYDYLNIMFKNYFEYLMQK